MNLAKMFREYEDLKKAADRDLRTVPTGVYQGVVMMVRKAQHDIKQLQTQYNGVVKSLIQAKVLVNGPQDVLDIVLNGLDVNVMAVSADTLYKEWAQILWPSVGNRHEFNLHQIFKLNGMLKDFVDQNKLRYEGVEGPSSNDVHSVDDCMVALKKCIQTKYGNNLLTHYISSRVQTTAFTQQVAEPFVLAVTNLDVSEFDDLDRIFPSPVTLLVPPKPETKEIEKMRAKLVAAFEVKSNTEESK